VHKLHSITPAAVHQLAQFALAPLLIADYKSVPKDYTLRLLLRIASTATTLFDAARRTLRFSHETARKALYHNLPEPDLLERRINDCLHVVLRMPARVRKRVAFVVAIDYHNVPFYGDKTRPGVVGGPKKAGTKYAHAYATACVIQKGQRYTLGLVRVSPKSKPHEVVEALLRIVESRGIRIKGVVLDAGFDGGETLLLLQERKLNYAVPLKRNGRGSNRRNALFDLPHGHDGWAEWTTEKSRRAVRTRVAVWQGESKKWVYAYSGWSSGGALSKAATVREWYRSRFGIETSYRQKNQCRGWTTSVSERYRLLLEGVSQVLRQVWVYLTAEIAASRGELGVGWVSALTFHRMLEWLSFELVRAEPVEQIPLDPILASPGGN
jgi:hypothetical protein